jgi:uncharacterized membrane protein YcaP (DUF421 family)
LVAGFALVGFHRLLAMLSFHSHFLGRLVKGTDDIVIENGEVKREAMKKNFLTDRDLLEDLRLKAHDSPAEVKSARIERSGDLSVIPMKESKKTDAMHTDKM